MMKRRTTYISVSLLMTVVAGCGSHPDAYDAAPAREAFRVDTGNAPRTAREFDDSPQKFAFAVHSDLTGGERERIFEVAMAQLSLLRPEFIIGVGDLIEGGTTDTAQLNSEWDWFDERARRAKAPVFYVGGNHDLTNSVMQDVWEQRNGPRYYHFIYKNVLFLVLDTEDNTPERTREIFEARARAIEQVEEHGWEVFEDTEYASMPEQSSGTIGPQQSAYFQQVIDRNPKVRWTFLFMHKAAWERTDEKNFRAIESALAGRPYTVFHGHEHAYRYQQRHGRDYIRLATTGGVQFADRPLSIDHVTMVTVSDSTVDIANLKLSGILDRTGELPLGGADLCFDAAAC